MTANMGFIILLLSQAAVTSAEPDVVCSPGLVIAEPGQDVTLQCNLRPLQDATNKTVEWRHDRLNENVHLYRYGHDDPANQSKRFQGRTSLSPEKLTKGDLSLRLFSVRSFDSGGYRCSFVNWTHTNSCTVALNVLLDYYSYSSVNITSSSIVISKNIGIGIIVVIVVAIIACAAVFGGRRFRG